MLSYMLAVEDNHPGASALLRWFPAKTQGGEWKHGKMPLTDPAGFITVGNFPHRVLWSIFTDPNPSLLIEGDSRENELFWLLKRTRKLIDTEA